MKTNRILLCRLLATWFVLAGATHSAAGESAQPTETKKTAGHLGTAELVALPRPVELRFQLDEAYSCSVLCATRDYRIEGHEQTRETDEATDQDAHEPRRPSEASRRSVERARSFVVSGQLIPIEQGQQFLLTFEITLEFENGEAEESCRTEKEGREEAGRGEQGEASSHARGSAVVECGKAYTLARFGERKVTLTVGEVEALSSKAALRLHDVVVVTFDAGVVSYASPIEPLTGRAPKIRFATKIVDIRPNGTIAIEGRRTFRRNEATWSMYMTGEVSPAHVQPDRQVRGEDVAEVRIETRVCDQSE